MSSDPTARRSRSSWGAGPHAAHQRVSPAAEQTRQALAALEGFKERIVPVAPNGPSCGAVEGRSRRRRARQLPRRARTRPLVKSGLPAMMAGVVSGVVGARTE